MSETERTTRVTVEEAVEALTAASWTEVPGLDDDAARLYDAVRAVQGLCEGTDRDVPVAALRSVLAKALGDRPLPEPRQGIHCYAGAFGADWDLDGAVRLARRSEEIVWTASITGHDLAIKDGDRWRYFSVKRPVEKATAGTETTPVTAKPTDRERLFAPSDHETYCSGCMVPIHVGDQTREDYYNGWLCWDCGDPDLYGEPRPMPGNLS